MNPRYIAYASANGRNPDEQLAHDAIAYPGGKMVGFMLWISAMIRKWRASAGITDERMSDERHAAFTAWLEAA